MAKKILMVCLGNICRSPVAEGVMRSKLEKYGLTISVDSAGTSNYHIGQHPDQRATNNAMEHGIDISKLKARQFSTIDFDVFDRIYVMDTSNFNDVMDLARDENDKKKVDLLLNASFPESNMSVPDPYYGGEQGFENVFLLIENACEQIAASLKR